MDSPIQSILSSRGIVTNSLLRIRYLLFPLTEGLQFALTRHHQKTSDAVITRSISIKTRWNPVSLKKTWLACSHHTRYCLFLNSLPCSSLCSILYIPRIPTHLYSWGENPLWFNGSGWWNVQLLKMSRLPINWGKRWCVFIQANCFLQNGEFPSFYYIWLICSWHIICKTLSYWIAWKKDAR